MYLDDVQIKEDEKARWIFLRRKLSNIVSECSELEQRFFRMWIKDKKWEKLRYVKDILEKIANKL